MYKQRRHALATLLPENSIALFFSGKAPYKVGDEKYPFSVDRSFYYLSGLDKENMIDLLHNIIIDSLRVKINQKIVNFLKKLSCFL